MDFLDSESTPEDKNRIEASTKTTCAPPTCAATLDRHSENRKIHIVRLHPVNGMILASLPDQNRSRRPIKHVSNGGLLGTGEDPLRIDDRLKNVSGQLEGARLDNQTRESLHFARHYFPVHPKVSKNQSSCKRYPGRAWGERLFANCEAYCLLHRRCKQVETV